MPKAACSDSDFLDLFKKHGAAGTARKLELDLRGVYRRRARLEAQMQEPITLRKPRLQPSVEKYPHRHDLKIDNGVVLVGSDSHYWPGEPSPAHRAFVKFCKLYKPKIVIKNGDELDGSRISRHPPIGWETRPSLIDEVEATKERLAEIEDAVGRKVPLVWPLGNHDARFETRLATVAPEYAQINGVHLRDHFPRWTPCWAVWINDDVVVKHRYKGGTHAAYNNTVYAGKTMVTGHLHALKVSPFNDYRGTRWGVDTGTIADPQGPQFVDYTEENPKDWRSGFVFLTFKDGKLLWPEVVRVLDDDHVDFRGRVMRV